MSETLNVSRARRLVSGHLGLSRSLGAPHPSALTGRGNKNPGNVPAKNILLFMSAVTSGRVRDRKDRADNRLFIVWFQRALNEPSDKLRLDASRPEPRPSDTRGQSLPVQRFSLSVISS